jgi:hypothetical protein
MALGLPLTFGTGTAEVWILLIFVEEPRVASWRLLRVPDAFGKETSYERPASRSSALEQLLERHRRLTQRRSSGHAMSATRREKRARLGCLRSDRA